MTVTETLTCTKGQHEWQRERKRGKKPVNCPEHTITKIVMTEAQREAAELRKIAARAERTEREKKGKLMEKLAETKARYPKCTCPFPKNPTVEQVVSVSPGCGDTKSGVCPRLDALRRAFPDDCEAWAHKEVVRLIAEGRLPRRVPSRTSIFT
jgi:hypothetical protein